MTIRITIHARSNLGQFLALALVSIPLIVFGLYLATGDVQAGDTVRMQGMIGSLFSAKWMQQKGVSLSTALTEHFKKYGRVELLVYFGAAILIAFLAQGLIGRFIRSYRFGFSRSDKLVERREMWLAAPAWVLLWGLTALVIRLVTGADRVVTVALPVWTLASALAPAAAWAWFPDWAWEKLRVPLPGMRVKLRVPKMVALWVAALVVAFLVGMIWHLDMMLSREAPAWAVAALVVGGVMVAAGMAWVPEMMRREIYVPGLRRQVSLERIKRMEVVAGAEGGAGLVMTFGDESTWTIAQGTPRRMQRVGAAVGRVAGLARRDVVTWARG